MTAEALPRTWRLAGTPCRESGGPFLVSLDCVDPMFRSAAIDVDEQRSTTDPERGLTVHYRYIHGSFVGTTAKFSFYFPPPQKYKGRFFQSTYPTVTVEDAQPDAIVLAIANGAYAVSTNNGLGVMRSVTTGGYRINASAAKLSRDIAQRLYGADAPVRGYIYGASGGAFQTIGGLENTSGIWDGGAPIVPGVPNAIPSFMSAEVFALRVLGDKLAGVADALEPGGSGDPYAGLSEHQATVLREVTRLGHPLRGWWQYKALRGGAFDIVIPAVEGVDASYAEDFWAQPGYEGHDDAAVEAARVQFDASVVDLSGNTLTLSGTPQGFLTFTDLVVTSGAAAGKTFHLVSVNGNGVTVDGGATDVDVGDRVRIDNSLYIALSYFQRHNVPSTDQYGWNQYRDPQGRPRGPQRQALVGEVLAQVFGGKATGRFNGKMIMLASIMDVQAYPWSADWYRKQAQDAFGNDLDQRYRLWYMDNADHTPPATPEARITSSATGRRSNRHSWTSTRGLSTTLPPPIPPTTRSPRTIRSSSRTTPTHGTAYNRLSRSPLHRERPATTYRMPKLPTCARAIRRHFLPRRKSRPAPARS
jgi:hypothetical protein